MASRPTGRNGMMEIADRFAGFTGDGCTWLGALASPGSARPERSTDAVLHLNTVNSR
jgi:hypothetical protein